MLHSIADLVVSMEICTDMPCRLGKAKWRPVKLRRLDEIAGRGSGPLCRCYRPPFTNGTEVVHSPPLPQEGPLMFFHAITTSTEATSLSMSAVVALATISNSNAAADSNFS